MPIDYYYSDDGKGDDLYDEDDEEFDTEPDYDMIADKRRLSRYNDDHWAYMKADTYGDTNVVMP